MLLSKKVYLWKHLLLDGTPRNVSAYVSTTGKFKLFVNGSLILSDTIGNRAAEKVDSATGIVSLVNGGDNVVALEAQATDSLTPGVAGLFSVMIDTTKHYQSELKLPAAALKWQIVHKDTSAPSHPTTNRFLRPHLPLLHATPKQQQASLAKTNRRQKPKPKILTCISSKMRESWSKRFPPIGQRKTALRELYGRNGLKCRNFISPRRTLTGKYRKSRMKSVN